MTEQANDLKQYMLGWKQPVDPSSIQNNPDLYTSKPILTVGEARHPAF